MATRVFLLSADEKAVHVITQILDEQDIRFEHSSDPTFTLKRLAGQHFDVLVVDCDNTESAMQVFNSARASHLNKGAIAVAIVEGKAGVPNAFRLGASLVLTKPVSLDQARNTLRTAVGMTRKDATEARPAVVPPPSPIPAPGVPTVSASTHPVMPTASAAPATSTIPAAASIPTSVPLVPHAPKVAPAPAPPAALNSAPAATAATVATPVAASKSELKVTEAPVAAPKPLAPLVPIAPPSSEPAALEKQTSAATSPKLTLQISEIHLQEAKEETRPVARSEKDPDTKSENKAISLSSAMLGNSSSEATIDKLETALKTPEDKKPEVKTEEKKQGLGSLEMFPPAEKDSTDAAPETEEFDDSAATLRAGAVPAFGGLGKQPFAGIEPTNNRRRGLIAFTAAAAVGAMAFSAAWIYAPGFKSSVASEYAKVQEQLLGKIAQPSHNVTVAKTAPAPPVAAPVAPADQTSTAAPTAAGAESASASNLTAPTSTANVTTAPNPTATTTAPTPSSPSPAKTEAAHTPVLSSTPPSSGAGSASLENATAPNSLTSATPKPADVIEVPEDYADDQVIHRVHPAYPKVALVRKLHGPVVLEAIINKQGKVDSLQMVSGDPILAQAAADAVKQWRYKPYSHNGDFVEFQTRVTVDFKLP